MIVDVLGGPIRVECIGSVTACGTSPIHASLPLTVVNWLLWGVLIACMAAIVVTGGRVAFSKSICDRQPATRRFSSALWLGQSSPVAPAPSSTPSSVVDETPCALHDLVPALALGPCVVSASALAEPPRTPPPPKGPSTS